VTSIEARVVLGLPPGFTGDELKRAYRRAASENHPDRGGSTEQMVLVNQAHALLSTHQPIETDTSPCEPGAWTVADIVAVIGAIAAAMFADNVRLFRCAGDWTSGLLPAVVDADGEENGNRLT
jgi:hypothetical protein